MNNYYGLRIEKIHTKHQCPRIKSSDELYRKNSRSRTGTNLRTKILVRKQRNSKIHRWKKFAQKFSFKLINKGLNKSTLHIWKSQVLLFFFWGDLEINKIFISSNKKEKTTLSKSWCSFIYFSTRMSSRKFLKKFPTSRFLPRK